MCGRFSLDVSIDVLIERYKAIKNMEEFKLPDEIFPTNTVPIVINKDNIQLSMMKWGFMPEFTKKPIINARAETVDIKPLFRNSFYNKRCLVPATSFFEWENLDGKKIKRRISVKEENIFSLAGLYNIFRNKNGQEQESFTIITTDANEDMKKIHHRMPVILPKEMEEYWLDINFRNLDTLKSMMKPYDGEITIV
ncbi:SOS response-associated peptidase [uncultured Tissierella sp.]|uniref:SOS response-associated peptidase n=1 Tax=uncultured Tissierella sp. TaxID=448160 RepID=UPI002805EC61|nr:SOS response-associated peptidase [uncultured Tissierella sp.]MDU5083103.1 SOS response-associated peptidase [Bacillota bacterium]